MNHLLFCLVIFIIINMIVCINEKNSLQKQHILAIVVCAFISCFVTVNASELCTLLTPCSCKFENGSIIDLTPLGLENGPRWKYVQSTIPNDTYEYCYNPCYSFSFGNKDSECAEGVAVCQVNKKKGEFFNCGDQKHVRFRWDTKESLLAITYNDPHNYRTTNVFLNCSPHTKEPELSVYGETELRNYKMILTSNCACPDGCDSRTMSFGTGLVIIFFISVLLYLFLGVIYMHLVRGAHGMELIPNIEFWRDFPLLVRDGCVYVSSGCRGESSYERI